MTAVRKGWSPVAQQDSVSLAEIRARYVGSRLSAQVFADMEALWQAVDGLRFELAAADERTRIAREERKSLEDQLWLLRLQLKREQGPV
jgi:hypothetical protein